MQIPSLVADPFVRQMSEKAEEIRNLFLESIKNLARKEVVKVMLADGTVSNQESFDPAKIRAFFTNMLSGLSNWTSDGVSTTNEKDLRRSFVKFETGKDRYVLSGHMSLQYHALLFYKPDHRVIEIQRELSSISDGIKDLQERIAPESDRIVEKELRKKGYDNMDHQKLFEVLFEHDDLTKTLVEAVNSGQNDLKKLTDRQEALLKEMDSLLLELYQTTAVLIDEMRMIAAEEGCLCVFNLEYVRGGSREGTINLEKIPTTVKEELLRRMDDITKVMKI
ncbi:MAG: hypothetical protein KGI33_02885 [Thaumarchaeota archaeon]|nr:hypothetical protein [Nitrososphaerota archaeon]